MCALSLREFFLFFGLQLVWASITLIPWIASAYSRLGGFIALIVLPLALILPAIFLPLVVRPVRVWIARQYQKGIFHKYDWNISWTLCAVAFTSAMFVLILFSSPLWWAWTHTIVDVPHPLPANSSYTNYTSGAAFRFDSIWDVVPSMMGQSEAIACDDRGCKTVFHCFAPILPANRTYPNLFWALCPYNKLNCTTTLADNTSDCFRAWFSHHISGGVIFPSDLTNSLTEGLNATSTKFNLGSPVAGPVVVQWEDVKQLYNESLLAFIIALAVSNGIVLAWTFARRLVLPYFCGPFRDPSYQILP